MEAAGLDAAVAAARRGDTDAFGELWRELSPRVAAYFRAHAVADADDLTSEVFLAAFRQVERFIGGGEAFRALVFSIAHHRRVDWLRRRARRGVPVSWEELDQDPRTTVSAEVEALESLGEQRTVALLAELTDSQREVIALRVLADLSLEQTAQVLGRDLGSVKSLQHRGLARLRRKVSSEPYPQAALTRWNPRHA
jgi:RNA polymerase sigma-70 factor (ECF subfamily)